MQAGKLVLSDHAEGDFQNEIVGVAGACLRESTVR